MDEFDEIVSESIKLEANQLLDRQITRLRTYREQFQANEGRRPTVHELILKLMDEPNQRRHVIIAYAAALTRLVDNEDRERSG